MGSIFGKPKQEPPASRPQVQVSSKDRAMLDLKVARDKLKKYQKRLEKDSEKLMGKAKQLVAGGQKERALTLLKLKRHKEKEVMDIDYQLVTVLEMIETVEWESHNLEIMKALKGGTDALKAMHSEMSVDDVERLLEESNAAIEMQNEIDRMLAGQFNAEDDAEISAELAALMGVSPAAPEAAVGAGQDLPLPAAPTHAVHVFPEVPTGVAGAVDRVEEQVEEGREAVPA